MRLPSSAVSFLTIPNARGNKFGYPICGVYYALLRLAFLEMMSLKMESFLSRKYLRVLSRIVSFSKEKYYYFILF